MAAKPKNVLIGKISQNYGSYIAARVVQSTRVYERSSTYIRWLKRIRKGKHIRITSKLLHGSTASLTWHNCESSVSFLMS